MKSKESGFRRGLTAVALVAALGVVAGSAQDEPAVSRGGVTRSAPSGGPGGGVDYVNARPMPLPRLEVAPMAADRVVLTGAPGAEPGSPGTGEISRERGLATDAAAGLRGGPERPGSDIEPQEHGTSNHPFTTSRVDLTNGNESSKLYPNRAAGKIYFKNGADTFVCSGALIKKGLIVTAAHCVAEFGASRFYSSWQFIPALSGRIKPYGVWSVLTAWVLTPYYNGTDNCYAPGVVCENDVAVLVVKPKGAVYPGKKTGWFGYGWDGYGFTPTSRILINQLGYPVSHDDGLKMQRTDSEGFVSGFVSNTVWGSRQTGGSSGGPEVVNLGRPASLAGGVLFGSAEGSNTIVGVTSWGYTDQATKQQGASRFTSTNIVTLVNAACTAYPAACAP